MAFTITKVRAYGIEPEEPVNRRNKQVLVLQISASVSDEDLDLGDFTGAFWTAVGGTANGQLALNLVKSIQVSAQTFEGVRGASIAGRAQTNGSIPPGSGDVVGPGTPVVDNSLVLFDGTTGNLIKGGSGFTVTPGVINGPFKTTPSPVFAFGSDTGYGVEASKDQYWAANAIEIMRLTDAGDLSIIGNFSAANFPTTGTANAIAGFDGSGDIYAIPSLLIDTTSSGVFQTLTEEPNGNAGGFTVNNFAVSFDPQQNSPNESWNIFNYNIQLDTASSGFTQGTAGQCATIINQGFTHNGTGDIGSLSGIQQNFVMGNGTDPIDVNGFGYIFGFGQVAANVTISGQIQGYGFQPGIDPAATLDSTASIQAFYDFTNAPVAVPGYTSFGTGPTIGSINNNHNHVSYNANPTITTLTGNAGYFGFACSPTIGTVNSGSTQALNYNPTITLNKSQAYGININMGNVTNYAGVVSSLVVQDITYTFLVAGDNNAYTMEYVNDVLAGNESFSIAGQDITCHIESGVSTATQVLAAATALPALTTAVSVVITGTASNPQVTFAQTNFAGGINPGTSKAALFVGDVEIQGALSFTGGLSVGALNSFASETILSSLGVHSIDTLITAPSVAASATITGTDLLAINTAMLLTIGAGASVTSSFLGFAALGLPAVLSMDVGSTIDLVEGAVFALSLDAGALGGTVDRVDLCRSLAIPNGVTTVTELVGYAFDLPFGDPGTTTWGFYSTPATAHNYFAGDVVVGTSDTPTNASVGIELVSTTKALLPSRMTTAQRDALTAVDGMVIYNTDDEALNFRQNGAWVSNPQTTSMATITFTQLNGAGSGVTFDSAISLPAGAMVISSFLYFVADFTGDGDSGSTISFGVGANPTDIHPDFAITGFGPGPEQGFGYFDATGAINATYTLGGTDTTLTAGEVKVYVTWMTP